MQIIIVGCGNFGAILSNRLSSDGHSVLVIDKNEEAFELLSSEFSGYKILGDATEKTILKRAQIEEADCLMATTNEDAVNMMVSQVAKYIFDVPKVVSRVYESAYEPIFEEYGIDLVSPYNLLLDAFILAMEPDENEEEEENGDNS